MSTTTLAPRVAPVSRPMTAAGELRLTRRGRVVVVLMGLVLMLAVAVWMASGAVGTADAGTQTPVETVVVGPGDTLWAIADDAAGSGSTADMMDRISDLNALDSSMLVAGQHLRVPTE